jgi:adenine-specific DNA methylase
MSSVIRDYNAFLSNRDSYISNIKKIREIYSIEQSKGDIAKSFSWPHETERNFSR